VSRGAVRRRNQLAELAIAGLLLRRARACAHGRAVSSTTPTSGGRWCRQQVELLRRAAHVSEIFSAPATRLMHSRHVRRRSWSCDRPSNSAWSQPCRASSCGRVMLTTNRGSGMGMRSSLRGACFQDRLDVGGQRNRRRQWPHLLNKQPAVRRESERDLRSHNLLSTRQAGPHATRDGRAGRGGKGSAVNRLGRQGLLQCRSPDASLALSWQSDPYAVCFSCLANAEGVPEGEVRGVAQVAGDPGWTESGSPSVRPMRADGRCARREGEGRGVTRHGRQVLRSVR
jgi:hypothetical protein